MAFGGAAVGRIGINVYPELGKFNEELKRKLEAAEKNSVDIPAHVKATKKGMADEVRQARDVAEEEIKRGNVKIRVPLGVDKDADTSREINDKVDETNKRLAAPGSRTKFRIPLALDPSQLVAEIKNSLRSAKAQLTDADRTINMIVKLDRDQFRREFDQFHREYNDKEIDLNANLDRQGRTRAELAALTRQRTVEILVRINRRSLATATATIEALTGVNVLRSTVLSLESFAKNIDRFAAKFASLGLIINTIASSSIALLSSAIGLFADLGSLGGFALALPTAAASVTAFAVVGVMAFKNFKDAVGGSAAAMNALPPAAAAAARSLQGTWTAMQVPVQAAFWSQMGTSFETLVKEVFPEVQAGLAKVGTSAGAMLRETLSAFNDLGGKNVFTGMFDNLARGMAKANLGIRPFVGAIIELGNVGSEYLPQVGTWFTEISRTFSDWVRRSSEAGRINMWLENAATSAEKLGRVFKATGGALSNIVDSTRSAGSGNLTTLADTMERIRRITDSAVFRTGLTNIFAGAHEAAQALKGSLGDLGRALSDLSPTIKTVLATSGVIVATLVTSISQAATSPAFKNGLTSFFDGIRVGVEGLSRYVPRIVDGLGDLGTVVGTIAANFGPVVGQVLGGVADLFRNITPSIRDLIPVLANFVSNSLTTLFAVLDPISDVLSAIISAFSALPGPIQTAAIAFLALSRILNVSLAGMFAPLLASARQVPTIVGNAFRDAAARVAATPVVTPALAGATSVALNSAMVAAFAQTQSTVRAQAASLGGVVPAAFQRGVTSQPPIAPRTLASAILPANLGSSLASSAASAVGKINLAPAVASSLAASSTGSASAFQRFGQSLAGYATLGMGSVSGAIRTAGAGVASAANGVWTGISNGAKATFSAMGGFATAGFLAVFTLIDSYASQARKIEQDNARMTDSFRNMATAAFEAGEAIYGISSQRVATDTLVPFLSQKGMNDSFAKTFGFEDKDTFESLLNKGGFGAADVSKFMAGSANAGLETFLHEIRARLEYEDGWAITRNWLLDPSGAGRDSEQLKKILDGIQTQATNAQEALDLKWEVDPQGGALNVLSRIRDEVGEGGKVTIDNIEGIQRGLNGLPINAKAQFTQFSNAFAGALGGAPEKFQKNLNAIGDGLRDTGITVEQIAQGDYWRAITRRLVDIGTPTSQITRALQQFGFSASEASEIVGSRFGYALNALGAPIKVLGENVPKLTAFSDGTRELATALSTASGIDTSRLNQALSFGGNDPLKTASALAQAGVAFSDIRVVMESMGVPARDVASALANIQTELVNTNSAASQQGQFATYSRALDAIRNSADGAAARATALLSAVDALKNGVNESAGIAVNFGTALESVRKLGAEGSTALLNLSQAIDPVNSKINFFAPGLDVANNSFNTLASSGLAATIQAMRDSAGAGGDFNAQIAAGQAVIDGQLRPTLDGLRADLEAQQEGTQVTDEVWRQLLNTYGLTPEEIITLATAQTQGATQDIQSLIKEIGGVPGQPQNGGPVTAVFQSLTADAVSKPGCTAGDRCSVWLILILVFPGVGQFSAPRLVRVFPFLKQVQGLRGGGRWSGRRWWADRCGEQPLPGGGPGPAGG